MKAEQWEVTKYGQLLERADIESGAIGIVTTKIYKYQDKYYVELWYNGYCAHFSEQNEAIKTAVDRNK